MDYERVPILCAVSRLSSEAERNLFKVKSDCRVWISSQQTMNAYRVQLIGPLHESW